MEHLRDKHHIIFIVVVIMLILFVLTSYPAGTQANKEDQSHGDVLSANAAQDNPACCTFTYQGTVKTCAAPAGQTCDVCKAVCAAHQ